MCTDKYVYCSHVSSVHKKQELTEKSISSTYVCFSSASKLVKQRKSRENVSYSLKWKMCRGKYFKCLHISSAQIQEQRIASLSS